MNDATFNELFGQDKPTGGPKMVRRRSKFTERNNNFLNDIEAAGCDPNTIINMALNIFIPKTYNHNLGLEEIIKYSKK